MLFLKKVKPADGSSLSVSNKDLTKLLETLQNKCEIATVTVLKNNDMVVNPNKVQSMIVSESTWYQNWWQIKLGWTCVESLCKIQ